MKKNYIVLFALLLLVSSFIYGQEKRTHNNIIVFDITGSMIGLPLNAGNENIWQPSLDLLEKTLNSFLDGEIITVYLFGRNLISVGGFSTNDAGVVNKIMNEIRSIELEDLFQSYTCIYQSLDTIIKTLDTNQTNTIYLFTDGRDSGFQYCSHISAFDLAELWARSTKEDEYLYIFKLKNFNLDSNLTGDRVRVIDSALYNYIVVIEPINKTIRVSKSNMNSSQQFRITGAGIEYLPANLSLITEAIVLENNLITESASSNPNSFNINNSVQPFSIVPHNAINNIIPGIYKGELFYSFDGNAINKIIAIDNINLTITIKNNTKVIFRNLEEPKATIKFIN